MLKSWPFGIPATMERTARKARRMFPNMIDVLPPGESGNVEISYSKVSAQGGPRV